MREHKKNNMSGITLIALVVTVIVLLLLAGISVLMITGNNGILIRAGEAKEKTEEVKLIEEIQIDILAYKKSRLDDSLTEEELESILEPKYGTLSKTEERTKDKKLTTKDGTVISVSRIYGEKLTFMTIANADPKVYYGQPIDYDVDLGKKTWGSEMLDLDGKPQFDWKIFYYDGINIYIIAEDYVPLYYINDKTTNPMFSTSLQNDSNTYEDNPYILVWDYNSGTMNNGKTGSEDIFGLSAPYGTKYISDKYLIKWKSELTQSTNTHNNAKMVAMLMDTNVWSSFANSTVVNGLTNKASEHVAIGAPTLEMWIKSWNQKHGDSSNDNNKKSIYFDAGDKGYMVDDIGNPSHSSQMVTLSTTDGYRDKLYFPHPAESQYESDIYYWGGYWLASPKSSNSANVGANDYTYICHCCGEFGGSEHYAGRWFCSPSCLFAI